MKLLLLATLLSQAPAPGTQQKVTYEDPNDPAYIIGKELRCPVCQGMPIAESPATMAQDMMTRVRALVAEGKSKEEILDYFAKSYGQFALLNPRAEGANWLVWLLPPIGLLFALLLLWRYFKAPMATEQISAAEAASDPGEEDDYLRLVREEVQR